MKNPSINDLAERADDRGDGYFFIVRQGTKENPLWQVGMRNPRDQYEHVEGRGATYADAAADMLAKQEEDGT